MTIRHRIAAGIFVLLFLLPLTGCGKPSVPLPMPESEGILTNVFAVEDPVLPSNLTFCNNCTPYYDAGTGTYTVLAQSETMPRTYHLLTLDLSGNVTETVELPVDLSGFREGVVTPDGLVVQIAESANEAGMVLTSSLLRISSDGTTAKSEELSALLGLATDELLLQGLASDAAGNTYLQYFGTIFVLDDALNLSFSLACDASNMRVREGGVWVGTSDGIAPIDAKKQSLGEKIPLPEGVDALECFAADGYALCYRTSEGIYGLSEDEATVEMLLNFQNSGLDIGTAVFCLIDRDTFLLSDGGEVGVWKRCADIDLSETVVLDVAYGYMEESAEKFLQRVEEFNKRHPEIRVITKDCQVYRDSYVVASESSNLVMDMLTGVYQPDVFVASSQHSQELSAIYEQKLYLDLYPFLDADPDISRDDLFGCVARTFEDTDGKLTALCRTFCVQSLVGSAERLHGLTSWTTEQMIDIATALPEDETFLFQLTSGNAAKLLYGQGGYMAFIDRENASCSFDSPEFIAYLNFLKTLPEKVDKNVYTDKYRDQLTAANPVVRTQTYSGFNEWMRDRFLIEGGEVSRIGYVSANGQKRSSYLTASPYVITSYCDTPDAAWTFLREMVLVGDIREIAFEKPVLRMETWYDITAWKFPVRKADYLASAETAKKMVYTEKGSSPYDPENPPSEKNGPYYLFTDEDSDELYRWLDEEVGTPYTSFLPPDLQTIVNEEISVYLGGAQTAEKCADVIQSRVGLWLSEHE